jgi:cation:H+ antiporter
MEYLLWAAVLVVGIYVLLRSANGLVHGAVQVMHHRHISASAFGIIVLAALTALPETFVSVISALRGNDSFAYGNLLGSNTTNIPLVLGLSIFLGRGINIHNLLWTRRNALFLCFATLIGTLTMMDLKVDRIDGLLLLAVFAMYLYSIFISEWEHAKVQKEVKAKSWLWKKMHQHVSIIEKKKHHNIFLRIKHSSVTILLVSAAGLIAGSNLMVMGAGGLVNTLHISELFIGLIGLGLATNLPEVASSIAAVKKGESTLGLSNIIGDNVATILLALGLTGLIHPIQIEPVSLAVDIPLLLFVTVFFTFILYVRKQISRLTGVLFLLIYLAVMGLYFFYHCLHLTACA